jgi:hypothetical protein
MDYLVSLATAHSTSAVNPNTVDIRTDSNRSWISNTVGGTKYFCRNGEINSSINRIVQTAVHCLQFDLGSIRCF